MKTITRRLVLVVFALLFAGSVFAEEQTRLPEVSFCLPSKSKTTLSKDQYVTLTIDGPVLVYDSTVIPPAEVVPYVNHLLEAKSVVYIGVHIREGTTYGDVVRAMDVLRKTNARSIGISVVEVPSGLRG